MSTTLDHAEMIRTRLMTAPTGDELATPRDITGVPVIVFRQQDLNSTIAAAVAKAVGTAIVIVSQGFVVMDENSRRPRLAQTYNIAVNSKPVLAGPELLAEDVLQSIILRLWHWRPVAMHVFGEAKVINGGLVPDKHFLKLDCEVVIPLTL